MAEEFDKKQTYINRDLSWLAFNRRVLEESANKGNPLLERLKFLAICSNNLDEFFMVRVAALKRLMAAGYNKKGRFGYYPQELYTEVRTESQRMTTSLHQDYARKLFNELRRQNIYLRGFEELDDAQKRHINGYMNSTLTSILTPMAIDQGRPFPVLASKTLAFAVLLSRNEQEHLAIIPIPKNISRVVHLQSEKQGFDFILVDEIIRQNLGVFFRGYEIKEATVFRLMRDSELIVDEGYAADLLQAIEREVKRRPKAHVTYLEVEEACSARMAELLCTSLAFAPEEVNRISGTIDLTYLFDLITQVPLPELRFKSYTPSAPHYENIFDKIKERDFLLHLPYQSFQPTVDLLREAAQDKDVLAIKITLYRKDSDSAIIKALQRAAANNKQVTVLVEIKARFDEAQNIEWVKALEEAGCHVIYGIAGMKIHSKIALVIRREEEQIRRYVHLSTGNYNERTATAYTDIGYFTANNDFSRDVSDVFNVITGFSLPARWKRIMSSPYDLRKYFCELIDKEIEHQKRYNNGLIYAKINSLEDTEIIDKLYEASNAGVKVRLIVRGICCLRPGIKDLSRNIIVKSVVGRFLEHSRVYLFNNNNNERLFLSSADWMNRNFDRRVELLFEVYNEDLKSELHAILETYWKDNLHSWLLASDGSYARPPLDSPRLNAQETLITRYCQ